MKIAAIKERVKGENRVAITPDTAKLFTQKGYEVFVEQGIGDKANFSDLEYEKAGATVSAIPLEILSDADIILKVQATELVDEFNEVAMAKAGALIIGLLSPYTNSKYLKKSLEKKLSTIAMELVPRVTKAQNMDVLSSQSNLAGYRAVIEAAYCYDRAFPMMMTAAGTISPAKTLILGVGVAGLQAIATAKRLGSIVSAYDVRAATKEQVESLGAKFVYPSESGSDAEDKSGYAKEVGEDFAMIQKRFLSEIIAGFDIVISTAQIPGKRAPMLLTKDMVAKMKPGSVIVDMATSSGGNIESSSADKIVSKKGVKIIGWTNMAAKIANDSSKLYAKNLYNLLNYAIKSGEFDFKDDLVEEMLIGKNGMIINKKFKV
ncbi:MAG: NAD(P)(+) transhydrogenase (Re/Si-specific) subunit alpha [Rickettsiales bacterium]|nr:MAG: NAD(P)(+) transhydrogenase (Re/Si-specific) subunit alpha [Rickettsiales bacterium]